MTKIQLGYQNRKIKFDRKKFFKSYHPYKTVQFLFFLYYIRRNHLPLRTNLSMSFFFLYFVLVRLPQYLKNHCLALNQIAKQGDPWVFLCASAYIEYLAKMTIGEKESYVSFIKTYLSQIDNRYVEFKYTNGNTDLPEQMFYILRNGLVHSFTLRPTNENKGRYRAILISHDDKHLSHKTNEECDSCILNAYDLISDLCKATDLVFELAKTDITLQKKISDYWEKYPPLKVFNQ